jgi:hypothetical protein
VEGCIRMEEIQTGLPSESWDQRCRNTISSERRQQT